MIRVLALLLALALPVAAQEAPMVDVELDPEEPVTVGTPLSVAITVLVPSYMPAPPVWPDLQIADAITRLPERATRPVTRRVGGASWSGLTRTFEIIPQRAADYDLGGATVTLTWAGETNSPQQAAFPVSDVTFSATVPAGAESLDPFLAASSLRITAEVEGLPDVPKPGDAFTLTLTLTASGPPAMLLPPLVGRTATPAGLRAYPREPSLAETDGTATRTEKIVYMIETPGPYRLPAFSVGWWNTARQTVETATTEAVAFDVAAPPGWYAKRSEGPARGHNLWLIGLTAALAALAAALVLRSRLARRKPIAPPSERSLYRRVRRTVRQGAPGAVRPALTDWLIQVSPDDLALPPAVEASLVGIERSAYGSAAESALQEWSPNAERRRLLAALAAFRRTVRHRMQSIHRLRLPPLNPTIERRSLNAGWSGSLSKHVGR